MAYQNYPPSSRDSYLTALFWAVDPSNVSGIASDGNAGWGTSLVDARTRPLLTFGELNARLASTNTPATSSAQCALMSDDLATPILTNIKGKAGTNRFCIIGDMTQVGSNYTATAYADAVPSANTGYLLSATGLGAAGNLGKLVTDQAQTKFAFILQTQTADQVLITQPHSFDPTTRTGATTGVTFAVSDTLQVWTLPSMSQYPFPGGTSSQVPSIWKCNINRSTLATALVDSSFAMVASILTGLLVKGGVGTCTGCLIPSSLDLTWEGGAGVTFRNCGTRSGDINLSGGNYVLTNNLTLSGAGATLVIGAGGNCEAFAGCSIGGFGNTGVPIIQLGHGGQFNSSGSNPVFGSGADRVFEVNTQCKATIDKTNCFATATVSAVTVHAVNYALAAVPIWDPNNGCGIFDL